MCRLFAWHSTMPVTTNQALGEDAAALAKLSEFHSDGWGLAYGNGASVDVVREPVAAHGSENFAEVTQSIAAKEAIVHLRFATLELPVCLANTHPFLKDGPNGQVAFCHNGSIPLGAQLDGLIDADLLRDITGDTDSERYFAALLSSMRRHDGDVVEAYRELLKDLSSLKYTSANAMVLTDHDLFVLCAHNPENRAEMFSAEYYEIHWRNVDGVVSAWSQGVREPGGHFLDNGHLLQISRATGVTTIHHVS